MLKGKQLLTLTPRNPDLHQRLGNINDPEVSYGIHYKWLACSSLLQFKVNHLSASRQAFGHPSIGQK